MTREWLPSPGNFCLNTWDKAVQCCQHFLPMNGLRHRRNSGRRPVLSRPGRPKEVRLFPCHLTLEGYINDKIYLTIHDLQKEQNKRVGNLYNNLFREINSKDWYFHCWFCFLIFMLKAALYVNTHAFLIYEPSCLEFNGKVPVFTEDSWILLIFIGYN